MVISVKNNRIYRRVFIAAAILLLLITGLYLKENTKKEDKSNIIYIPKIIDEKSDFWSQLIEGVEMAAKEYEMEVVIAAAETEDDYQRQNELIEWAVGQKPDALLLSPANYTETVSYAKKAVDAGIPLILIDSAVNKEIADTIVATNNVRLGEVEGNFIRQFISEDSEIAIIGHVKNSSTGMEREQGVRKGLGEYEDQIVDVVYCNSDYDKAYQLLKELVKKYPGLDMVVGLNEYSAVGAARAIKDMNLKGKIKVVGIDSSLEEIQLLEEGIFEGIVIQNPFKMGYLGVEAAAKILNGEQVLKNIDSGCKLITKENAYMEENQKLLFPFKEE